MRVLLVEDDRMIGTAVTQALVDAAYAVDWVEDGDRAITAVKLHAYDFVLLDLGLPRMSGFDVLGALRARGVEVPVVIVTARDALADRIRGLDMGADDYLVKPFAVGELLARMRAVFRRKGGTGAPLLSNGEIVVDPASHAASFGARSCVLTSREFALMHALLSRPGAILSRQELEDRIYGWNEEVESNVVEFVIHSVRKKLGAEVIRNVRGVGWTVTRRS